MWQTSKLRNKGDSGILRGGALNNGGDGRETPNLGQKGEGAKPKLCPLPSLHGLATERKETNIIITLEVYQAIFCFLEGSDINRLRVTVESY